MLRNARWTNSEKEMFLNKASQTLQGRFFWQRLDYIRNMFTEGDNIRLQSRSTGRGKGPASDESAEAARRTELQALQAERRKQAKDGEKPASGGAAKSADAQKPAAPKTKAPAPKPS